MASSKEYVTFVLDQCKELTARAMMGEYVVYYRGKVIGGIYDNCFLIKPTPSAQLMLPDAPRQIPYPGAKEMLVVENAEDRIMLGQLFAAMYDELPQPKKRSGKTR